eukprot:CAMPEP_0173469262 /NCGR_PEP_ID=MMETSP1357-20121228/77273_1 /TAXON_ID=77926 /ORGANISM="Hemiselmis rufescens, Strain PCC563" /LENGTH=112 /DNA_ID=CAMNT_0014437499 /DNA_START=866 /DNA_END=1204 /DNA_ORIENTATION=+
MPWYCLFIWGEAASSEVPLVALVALVALDLLPCNDGALPWNISFERQPRWLPVVALFARSSRPRIRASRQRILMSVTADSLLLGMLRCIESLRDDRASARAQETSPPRPPAS